MFWMLSSSLIRLRVVSNFGDGDCGAREISRRRVASKFRARACVFRPPHNRHRQN